MSARSYLLRAFASLAVLIALLAPPSLAYAGGTGPKRTLRVRVNDMSVAARAKAARVAMGGMSVGANVAWSVGTGVIALSGAAHGHMGTLSVFGGFSAYNGVQAFRKWKAETAMNK